MRKRLTKVGNAHAVLSKETLELLGVQGGGEVQVLVKVRC